MTPRAQATYYVKFDTYWQNSPDWFAGPFASRNEAQAAIDVALTRAGSKVAMSTQTSRDVRHGIRVWDILSRSEALRDGLRLDWDGRRNCIGKVIPADTDHLFDLADAIGK